MTDHEKDLLLWLADYILTNITFEDPRRAELRTLIEGVEDD